MVTAITREDWRGVNRHLCLLTSGQTFWDVVPKTQLEKAVAEWTTKNIVDAARSARGLVMVIIANVGGKSDGENARGRTPCDCGSNWPTLREPNRQKY